MVTSKAIADVFNRSALDPHFVGFDSLFENMAQMSAGSKSLPSYPPYNVIQDGDVMHFRFNI